jgi:lysozyme
MNRTKLKDELRRDEGLRLEAYYCPAGHRTIGYGHLVADSVESCSLEQAEEWLADDIQEAIRRAENYLVPIDIYGLAELRQRALANLAFNIGNKVRDFRRMKAAIGDGDWDRAARELENSKYARQVGQRAVRLAQMLRKGSDERE